MPRWSDRANFILCRNRFLTDGQLADQREQPFLHQPKLCCCCLLGGSVRSGGNVQQPSQKSGYDTAQRAAQMLRAEVIDLFAQVEHAVDAVLVHAATLPEYKTLKPVPHLLGQKLQRLRQLKTAVGPLRSHANGVAPLVDKLAAFEKLRHFMAHGIVEVALKQSGEPIYIFRISCASSYGSTGSTLALTRPDTLTLTRPDAQSHTARLAVTVRALASNLTAIMDGINKPSKHRVRSGSE